VIFEVLSVKIAVFLNVVEGDSVLKVEESGSSETLFFYQNQSINQAHLIP
jgi:hypothetical protein